MERINISNYDEIKSQLINYIMDWTATCHRYPISLSLQADPDAGELIINDITRRGYYKPYEVMMEEYEGCFDDSVNRYFKSIKDIADALNKSVDELIQEVVSQPEYIDWMDPIDVTYDDVHDYVIINDSYMKVLDDIYTEYIHTDCYEIFEDRAETLLEDAIDFMERKYDCELEV